MTIQIGPCGSFSRLLDWLLDKDALPTALLPFTYNKLFLSAQSYLALQQCPDSNSL
jgi:hypothetical protein